MVDVKVHAPPENPKNCVHYLDFVIIETDVSVDFCHRIEVDGAGKREIEKYLKKVDRSYPNAFLGLFSSAWKSKELREECLEHQNPIRKNDILSYSGLLLQNRLPKFGPVFVDPFLCKGDEYRMPDGARRAMAAAEAAEYYARHDKESALPGYARSYPCVILK